MAGATINVLVIQNEANEGLGIIAEELDKLGSEVEVVKVFDGQSVPLSIDSGNARYSHLIVLGGTATVVSNGESVYKEGQLVEGHLNDTISLIKDCFQKDVAVLGICLGAQMMARALGARVYRGSTGEAGWQKVSLTKDGRGDKIFSVFKDEEVFFQWHGDTFDVPTKFGDDFSALDVSKPLALATSELFTNQAFTVVSKNGRRSYGLQFHPEVNSDMVSNWKSLIKKDLSEDKKGSKNKDFVNFKDLTLDRENNIMSDFNRNKEFFYGFLKG